MKAVGSSSGSNNNKAGRVVQKNESRVLGGGRKRKAGVTPPTTVELRGVNIHFPFKPYKCQEDYMGKVLDALLRSENALLESPTGTGKTLCLLCATLAWQREQAKLSVASAAATNNGKNSSNANSQNQNASTISMNNNKNNNAQRVPTIIYASRTHSQLSQVVRELRNTRYRPKHSVLGSRDQMCVHPKVKKETSTSSDINHDCNTLSKERKCRFRNALEGFMAPNPSYEENTQAVLDMEDLVKMGKENKVCPFYYTRSLLPDAELVLMPYNYLFDKDTRENTLQDIAWDNAIVIFDEAHNLESFATESASFDLTQTDLAMCVAELNRALNYMAMMDEDGSHVKTENVTRLKALFLHFEDYLSALNRSGAFSGEYMMDIFTKGMSINFANYPLFIDEVKKVSDLLLDARGGGSGGGGATTKGAPKLEHFIQCIKRVFGETTEARCMAKAKSYRVHISPKEAAATNNPQGGGGGGNGGGGGAGNNKAAASRTLSYWCFAPALAMQELSNLKIRSIIVTSGTLSPLQSYSMELGIPFAHTLENPHIITDEQILVRVVGKGVSGKVLTSSYQRRKDAEYYTELGNTLVSLAKVVPGGMLIFFPSYSVMETSLERWGGPASSASRYSNSKKTSAFFSAKNKKGTKASNRQQYSFPFTAPSIYGSAHGVGAANPITPWKRLIGAKAVVIEPRSTADLADAISEFHKYLNMPKSKGCILMGVCRGKISEGIDFADNMSRAVIITGLPFPPAFDPKVKLKREYLDGTRASKSVTSKEAGGFGGSSSGNSTQGKPAMASQKAVDVLSGHEWYSQQAHRAVNQAIGRVIRNRTDYGAILLLDSRYAQPGNQQGLSKWVRPHLQPDEGVGPTIGSLVKFYRKAEARAKEQERTAMGVVLEYEQEAKVELKRPKPKQPQEDPTEKFTKVAFIRKMKRDLDTTKASLQSTTSFDVSDARSIGNDIDTEEPMSYIGPDQVVARVDVSAMMKKRESASVNPATKKPAQGSLPQGRESAFGQSVGRKPTQSSTIVNNSGQVDSKKIAVEFFKKAQKILSTAEFSTIRKSIVAMKQHGDKEDRKSYLRSAKDVLSLCIQRDQYFGRYEKDHDGSLLFMFFTLLPAAYRPLVERTAMKGLFNRSELEQLCKENLPEDQHNQLLKEMPKFLQRYWCGDNASSGTRRREFLRESRALFTLLQEDEKPVSSSAIAAFMKLVPSRLQSVAQALLDEMAASQNVLRLKANEARSKGEDAIDPFKFRRAPALPTIMPMRAKAEPTITAATAPTGSQKGQGQVGSSVEGSRPAASANPPMASKTSVAPMITSTKSGVVAAKAAPTPKTPPAPVVTMPKGGVVASKAAPALQSSRMTNPYAKKVKSLSSYVQQAKSQGIPKAAPVQIKKPTASSSTTRAAPAYTRRSELSKSGKPTSIKQVSTNASDRDPMEAMLHEAQAEPFVKRTSGDIVRGIKSNVPSHVCCVICSNKSHKPMIGDNCGHMACQSCWLQWLKRSETCPVCRKNTKPSDLSLVVFQDGDEGGRDSVTLSQFCS